MNYLLLLPNFMRWWYSEGILRLFSYELAILEYISNVFSIKESLLHLFSPWKRLVGPRRKGLDGLRDWLIDNIVSRGVGFVMRLFLIIIFLISSLVAIIGNVVVATVWLSWPVLIPWLFFWGIINV